MADAQSDVAKSTPESERQVGALDAAKPAAPAEPFPADAVKREAKETAASSPAPAAQSANAGVTASASGKLADAPATAAREEAKRDAARATAPVAQSLTPSAPAPMRRMQEADAARAAPASNFAGGAVDARAKIAPKLAVPDWITLIHKLRDEGKTDQAAKELAAFRAAYPDHERLLPADLRDWKPGTR